MATYKIEWLNNNIEIVDPVVIPNPDGIILQVTKGTITCPVLLTIPNSEFGMMLEDVAVQDFNYDYDQLMERVLTALERYEV